MGTFTIAITTIFKNLNYYNSTNVKRTDKNKGQKWVKKSLTIYVFHLFNCRKDPDRTIVSKVGL